MSEFFVSGYISLEYADQNRSAVQEILKKCAGCDLDTDYIKYYMPSVSETACIDGRMRLTIEYNSDEQYNYAIFGWFSDLFENRGESTYSISGKIAYCGDQEGRISISDADMESASLDEMADDAEDFYNAKDAIKERYQALVRASCSTDVPEIRFRMQECELCLKSVFGFSGDEVLAMYEEASNGKQKPDYIS